MALRKPADEATKIPGRFGFARRAAEAKAAAEWNEFGELRASASPPPLGSDSRESNVQSEPVRQEIAARTTAGVAADPLAGCPEIDR